MKLYDKEVTAIKDHVIVANMNFGERVTMGGIIKLEDDGRDEGIRPRWGRVYSVGPEQKDIKIGEWVLVNHGRWTRGVDVVKNDETITLRRIDANDILIVADEPTMEY
jgi:hypothetical protein